MALGKLSSFQRNSFLAALMGSPNDEAFEKRLLLLDNMFSSPQESSSLKRNLGNAHIALDELPTLLSNEAVLQLVESMLDDPKQYRFQLGIIFSEISLHTIPERIKTKMKPLAREMELTLKPEHGNWFLCSAAEPRLLEAMDDQATILVDDALLVKGVGRLSGLALETVSTREGKVIQEGNWYAPTDPVLRQAIRNAFDEGKAKITLEQGTWALMRPIADDEYSELPAEAILARAKQYAADLPETLPAYIGGMERKTYREENYENQ